MKRLKYLLLIGLLVCTVGCQKHDKELFPVELGEPDPAKVEETKPSEPVQDEEDDLEKTIEEEKSSYSDATDIDDYINANLVLEDDEEIESCEWVGGINEGKNTFRVRICYKEQPENEYKHKRDFFVYRKGDELTSITVDYPSKSYYDAPRYVYDANDFAAYKVDVNFDGYNDLLISLGYEGSSSGSFWCAYLYDRGDFVYNESFEKISNYRLEDSAEVIYSSYVSQNNPVNSIYRYDEAKHEFTEICSYNGMDGEVYNVIANLIVFDKYFQDDNEKDWIIVSTFGEKESVIIENKDGFEQEFAEKLTIEDLEIFYNQVYGEDKTFEDGYDNSTEVGIFCKDGYAYAHNGVGWGEYPVITNIEKTDNGVKVYCAAVNGFSGRRDAAFKFTLIESDNKFGYSLVKDSVEFTADAWALSDEFANADKANIKGEDFNFIYKDKTFDITSDLSDYVDALGYPEGYEENNYGYVTTDNEGYRFAMCYPSQSEFKYDFQVVLVSPSMEREGEDTYVESVSLNQTETARGIKAGDSVSDLAASYGKSFDIYVHDGSDEWMDITYSYMDEYTLVFVVADNKILYIKMYQNKKSNP